MYCCDICGNIAFKGIRYHCLQCEDYDVCESCQKATINTIQEFPYKYHWENDKEKYIQKKIEQGHSKDHQMIRIKPICSNV